MAEAIKQLKIRTAAVTRLKKEYQSYINQIKAMKSKIGTLPTATEQDQAKIKKENEFLGESESVLSNVKQKLIESYEDLDMYVKQKSAIHEVDVSPEKEKAVEVLKEIESFLEEIQ